MKIIKDAHTKLLQVITSADVVHEKFEGTSLQICQVTDELWKLEINHDSLQTGTIYARFVQTLLWICMKSMLKKESI